MNAKYSFMDFKAFVLSSVVAKSLTKLQGHSEYE